MQKQIMQKRITATWRLAALLLSMVVLLIAPARGEVPYPVPATLASNSGDDTLKILEPAADVNLSSSNIQITVQFNFDMQAHPGVFEATLNGRPVGSLFEFEDRENHVAKASLSIKDGLHADEKGPRMNVFVASVVAPDGKKHRAMVQFTVDCSGNHAPVAVAAKDETVFAHEFVQLDGSGSSDIDDDPLAYKWSFITVPKQSKATLSDASAVNPNFIPDMPGTYVIQLIADDYKAKSEPKIVTIKADQLKILIDRPVDDAIYEMIKKNSLVTLFDGSRPLGDHHLAILDGKGVTADALKKNELLKKALAAGKWGLVFNVAEEHKDTGLTAHVGMVSKGKARAFLFRRLRDGNTPVFSILELPEIEASAVESNPDILIQYAGILLKKLRESSAIVPASDQDVQAIPSAASVTSAGAAASPDTPIPADLINLRWDYKYVLPFSFDHSGRHSVASGRTQHGSYVLNYTFTLFLDNGNNPTGNKQWLLLQIDTESNPNNYGSTFIATSTDMEKHNEYAWFQDYITVDVAPVEPDPYNPIWNWAANDPTSPNNLTTYSANASFTMGFNQAQGLLGSFTCSHTTQYTLADWGALCSDCSATYMKWKYHSTNPPEHSGSYFGYWDMYDWYYGLGKPKRPNAICMGQNQFHAAVVWSTDTVRDQVASFKSMAEINLVDNWCERDLGTTACSKVHTAKVPFSKENTWSLDLGAVLPIPVQSITFSSSPVQVGLYGTTVTGHVNLAAPAKIDTKIKLESNSTNATLRENAVTILQGDTTASFLIDVNPNGLQPGQSYSAGISAFYATRYTYPLYILFAP